MSGESKGAAFRALHEAPGCFTMPNAWDAGSAKVLAGAGFKAIGTTSAGLAYRMGVADAAGEVGLEAALENIREIAKAVDIPVNADFENGYADDPRDLQETIRRCAEAGAAGAGIEDYTGDPSRGLYDPQQAVERIAAAVEAAESLPEPFTITARAESYLYAVPDAAEDALSRLQAYARAGAHCVYAPGVRGRDEIERLALEAGAPVNVLVGISGLQATHAEMSALGVRRLSVGAALARRAYRAVLDAVDEMREGRFDFADRMAPDAEILGAFAKR